MAMKHKLQFLKRLGRFSTDKSSALVGSIDQSTTSTKFALFNQKGQVVESSVLEHKQYTPNQGWLEHNPMEILDNLKLVIQQTVDKIEKKNYSRKQIKAIGITNQRETVVAWDKNTGKPYHNAIVWSDTRTLDICRRYIQKHDNNKNFYKHITGLPINTYFTGFKIKWLIENVPEIKQNLNKNVIFGTMDSWIIWNLCNKKHISDASNVSRTFLMNLSNLKYENNILKEFEIPEQCLPEIKSNCEVYGEVTLDSIKGAPITASLGDQMAASVGHGVYEIGNSKNTYGTGCFLLVNIGEQPKFLDQGLLTTVLYQKGQNAKPVYAFEGSIEVGASTVNWARQKLGLFKDFNELDQQLFSVKDNGGIYFVPAFSGLFSPFWREDATGTLIGMSFHTEKAHILRALLESIAYRTKDVINTVENDAGITIDSLKVDGGVTANRFLMKFQSDLLQKKLIKTKVVDSTMLGVAFMAGIQQNIWKDFNETKKLIENEKIIEPDPQFKAQGEKYYAQWQKALQRTLDWKT